MVLNRRPKDAAQALGCSESHFWWLAKNDPDFPPLIKLGPKWTVVRDADLAAYVDKKARLTASGKELAAA
ncbi:MAG: hypothetical protein Q8Q82_13835 [Hydrogenophaga sp.]|nr:hypothetical protein [Hydrogenophaga sp.]